METLFLLLLVAACHGIPIDIQQPQQAPQLNLPIPKLKKFESVDDPNNITSHEIITWTAVESDEPDNPIIGYKLKVWEVKKIKQTKYKNQGGQVVRVLEESYPKISINVIPDGVPKEIITPANVTTAIFPDMHVDVVYQFAVLAFTAMGEGPLSAPIRIRIHGSSTNTEVNVNKNGVDLQPSGSDSPA